VICCRPQPPEQEKLLANVPKGDQLVFAVPLNTLDLADEVIEAKD
jgi:hypothetical protein